MTDHRSRITIDPRQCGGRPCIRGMRIRVADVLDLLAAGLSSAQVVEQLLDLEPDDVAAALQFASCKLDQSMLAEQLWDGLEPREREDVARGDEQLAELRRRRAALETDGDMGEPWEAVLDQIESLDR